MVVHSMNVRRTSAAGQEPYESAGRTVWHDTLAISPPSAAPPCRCHAPHRNDPLRNEGLLISRYSSTHPLDEEDGAEIIREIQDALCRTHGDEHRPGSRLKVVDDDACCHARAAHRFFVTSLRTERDARASVGIHLCQHGQTLFCSIRSYLLPPLSIVRAVASGVASILLVIVVSAISFFFRSGDPVLQIGGSILAVLAILCWIYSAFIAALVAGDLLGNAIRRQFPRKLERSSPDAEDVSSFQSSQINGFLRTTAEVLRKHGMDVSAIAQLMNKINITYVDNRGGLFNSVGSNVGGADNTIDPVT